MSRRVEVHAQKWLFDDFFKINELKVSHERFDGTMSGEQRRLVFERGDSVAVLLFNRDTGCVVLVDQFRAPILGKGNGWLTETVAGMLEPAETAEQTAIRETMEETGYRIAKPKLIATFFSSPGGTSERIFLYSATVGKEDKVEKGGGLDDEDIRVHEVPLDELLKQISRREIEDPKLLIAALSLQEELKDQARMPLPHGSVVRHLADNSGRIIGYKTGPITGVEGVSIWVNSENEDMKMDRFIGRSISANIRFLGASKDADKNVIEDTINDELVSAIGPNNRVRIGTVVETGSGSLATKGVNAIFHVATVRRGIGTGGGFKADPDELKQCTTNVLLAAHERNQRAPWIKSQWARRLFGQQHCASILIPMLGAGDGGLRVEEVAPQLFKAAAEFFRNHPATTLKEIYFLAYTAGHKSACDRELDRLHQAGFIT